MSGFARHRRSKRIIATFSALEAMLLRSLASQIVELLESERAQPDTADADPLAQLVGLTGGPSTPPEDPVLQRLLPSAYPDDAEASGDFRRYTEGALRDGKVAGAMGLIDSLHAAGLPEDDPAPDVVVDVELDQGQAQAWLKSLTDIRLALATRLGVEEDDDARWLALPDDDPEAQAHDIYEWVGYLQETLVLALTK